MNFLNATPGIAAGMLAPHIQQGMLSPFFTHALASMGSGPTAAPGGDKVAATSGTPTFDMNALLSGLGTLPQSEPAPPMPLPMFMSAGPAYVPPALASFFGLGELGR